MSKTKMKTERGLLGTGSSSPTKLIILSNKTHMPTTIGTTFTTLLMVMLDQFTTTTEITCKSDSFLFPLSTLSQKVYLNFPIIIQILRF